jgi:amino acid adenylation domain-containing protein
MRSICAQNFFLTTSTLHVFEKISRSSSAGALHSRDSSGPIRRGDVAAMNVAASTLTEVPALPAYSLSVAQTHMWLGHTVSLDHSWYNIGGYFEIHGALDTVCLAEAVRYNLAETENLNSVFQETADGPVQCMLPEVNSLLVVLDLCHVPDPRAAALAWIHADYAQPFDLTRGPLYRNALLQIAPELWILYGVRHHLITDAFSFMVSGSHLAALYTWLVGSGQRPPRPLASALDLLEADMAYCASGQEVRDRIFWRDELAGRPEPCTLSGRAPVRGGQQHHASLVLPDAVARDITRLGHSHHASLAAVIMAATATYLSRLTGARDLVLGMPVANRPSPKLRRVIGLMANVVPLRLQIDMNVPFADLLSQTARRMRSAFRHQRYHAGALRQDHGLLPDQPEIYGTLVNVIPVGADCNFAGATARRFHLRNGRADDLMIAALPAEDGRPLEIVFSANAANYTPDMLARHMAGFEHLLKDAIATPYKSAGRLRLMSDERRARLLPTDQIAPPATTLLALFEAQAARGPDALALLCGHERLSYRALDVASTRVARRLHHVGIVPGSLIGLCISRTPEAIAGLLGIMKAGGAYVPLDLAMPPVRLGQILDDARPVLVLVSTDDECRLPPGLGFLALPTFENGIVHLEGEMDEGWRSTLLPSHLAYVIFTSGSTGLPKGVMVSHQGIAALAVSHVERFGVTAASRVLQFASLAFDASVAELATAWGSGAALVLAPQDALSGPALERLIETAHVTHATLPPAVLATLTPRKLPLECLAVAGDSCPADLAARWSSLTRMINAYGPTETTVCVTLSEDLDGDGVPIGRPISGSRIYVLDAALEPVPEGIEGEIYIAGESLANGYLNRPGDTATRFVADPFGSSGSRMYRSGDRAYWRPDGQLAFLGRADRQVKIRGMRVEPAEVEAVLRQLPGIADAVVVTREDRPFELILAAYLVLTPDCTLDMTALRGHLAGRLASHMLPTAYVALPSIPLTANGKLDRLALPKVTRDVMDTAFHEPPQGERETEIAAIWEELLGLERVGRLDNFFALGGHSLLLITLAARLRERGWTANFAILFNDLSPATLAGALTELPPADKDGALAPQPSIARGCVAITPHMVPLLCIDQPSIDRIVAAVPGGSGNVQEIYPLSPLQEGILFHHRTTSGRDAYVLSVLLTVDGDERLASFLAALQTVIQRHDSLRTAFQWEKLEEPVQVVWQTASLPVETLDALQGDVREALWRKAEAGAHIDLRQAPLLRLCRAWDEARGEWCVLLHFHHAVTDHVTLERIIVELRTLLTGEAAALSLSVPYRDALILARRTMSDQDHSAFFRSRLSDIDSSTAPFGVQERVGEGDAVDEARLAITPGLAEALRGQASGASVSCAALFHAAWALVLTRITGRQDVVFGTVLSGRLQGSAASTTALGLVINTLPLRLSLHGLSVAEALREVQASLAALLAHEQASLALAQSCSAVVPPTPLFTTLLNCRHSEGWAVAAAAGALPSWEGVRVLRALERSHYAFMLTVDDFGTGFELKMQAPRSIAASPMAAFMSQALAALVQALVAAPGSRWEDLDVWPDPSWHQLAYAPGLEAGNAALDFVTAEEDQLNTSALKLAPLSPTQARLASIWCSTLGVAHVDRNDDFFALGGHSLSALRVMTQIRESFGVDLPLKTLFVCRTLESLAGGIDELMQDEWVASTTLPSLQPCAPDGPVPLSHGQERMWLVQSLAPQSTAYNMVAGLMMTGQLNVAALADAILALCDRRDILRSVIRTIDGVPMQYLAYEIGTTLETVDLRDYGTQAESAAHALAERQIRMPFDLAQDRPFRAMLAQLEDERFLLILVVHHVMADQWSIGILGRELAALYNSKVHGRPALLDALQVSYRDYAVWQRTHVHGHDFADQLAYWRTQLADLPTLELPTDRPHPALPSFDGALCLVPIPPSLIEEIGKMGRSTGATLFMIMLSALVTVLHRLSGQTDIPIAVPVANRAQSATEALVGTFVNTLVLRADLSGKPSFKQLVQRVRATALDAFEHQDVPFDWLVKELAQRQDANRAPLTQVMFNVANMPMHGIAFEGLSWQPVVFDRGGAQFDLSVTVDVEVSGTASFEYSTEIFDHGTIERLAAAYFTLLEAACSRADTPIHRLSLLPPSDLAQLRMWNDTTLTVPGDITTPQLFHAQAVRQPEATALSCQGETMTYAELDARSSVLARHLCALGAAPGLIVAMCVPRTLALPVALLGILKSGAAYLPLDPDYPLDRLGFMLADSSAHLFLTADGCADGIECPVGLRTVDLSSISFNSTSKFADELAPTASQQDAAYVIYTSGSTGRPKGVVISHTALVNFLFSMQRRPGLAATDRLASVTTISFDIAALEIFLPLTLGAAVELVPRAIAANGEALSTLLVASGATVMQATPATWRLLLEAGWQGGPGFRALCGGESLPRDLADAVLERVAELWNLYGPTETTIWSSLDQVVSGQAISIGRPIANTQIHILDKEGEAVPIGFQGEICIGGAGVAIGYLNRPELTAERFVTALHEVAAGAKLYRTGDLGVWNSDGRLQHRGRSDHQVKLRGFRVETGEIESVLAAHPAVRQAVVVLREAQPGDSRVVAYIMYRDGEDMTASEVRRHLRHTLPDFMIPSVVVALTSLPLTPNGKIDRRALPDPFQVSRRVLSKGELPSPGMEQIIAAIWCSILDVKEVFAEDNFFEIGGHSLLALRVSIAFQQQTGFRLDPRTLFFHSLRQLAGMAKAGTATDLAVR